LTKPSCSHTQLLTGKDHYFAGLNLFRAGGREVTNKKNNTQKTATSKNGIWLS